MMRRMLLSLVVLIAVVVVGMYALTGFARTATGPQDFAGGWQYATLTVSTRGGTSASWFAGVERLRGRGSSSFASLNTQLGGNGSSRNVYELIDQIGAEGWELVEVIRESNPPTDPDVPFSGVWCFKRPR